MTEMEKFVAQYPKHSYAVAGNVTFLDPTPLLGVTGIDPSRGNIYAQCDHNFVDNYVVVGNADGYDTEEAALAAASAELAEYWRQRTV
jgi:hypothetical protein